MNELALLLTSKEYLPYNHYWTEQLSKVNAPFSFKSGSHQNTQQNTTFSLNYAQQAIITKMTQGRGLETFIILLSAYTILLSKYTHQSICIIDTPLLQREQQVTSYTDTVNLITTIDFTKTIKELILHTNQIITQSYQYQHFPVQLLAQQLNKSFQLTQFFAYFSEIHPKLPNLTQYDLIVAFEREQLTITYNTELFNADFIKDLFTIYQNILAYFTDVNVLLKNITLLDESEKQRILFDFNATQTTYPKDKTIVQLFEQQVENSPTATALVFENTTLTYAELNQKANQLAHYLREQYHIQTNDFVAIILERSENMIIAILAILKAGGAYLPIEPDAPIARSQLMLTDCQVTVILTDQKRLNQFDKAIDLTALLPTLVTKNTDNLPIINQSTDLAYVMYTSGSTGQPKGVLAQQCGVVRLVKNTNYTTIKPSDRLLQLSNYAFDGSTFDIFATLLNGASVYLFNKDLLLSIENLCYFIINHRINITFITTALFNKIIDINPAVISQFDKIYFGGQEASLKHVRIALKYRKNADSIVHVYGPTENTTFSTYHVIDKIADDDRTLPIGTPISNSQVYVLDDYLNPLPISMTGEIYVSGDGIARGYLHNPELTQERFLPHPFIPNQMLYKTGDLGTWLPNGQIDFQGRKDEQVKIRGFRVELGEIENALLTHPYIQQAFVMARQLEDSNNEVVAYIVGQANITEIRTHLAQNLPDYMIPAHFVPLTNLPLNQNGKVDKHALPAPESASLALGTDYIAPRNAIEQKLADAWQTVLDRKQIGIYDNYFALGGDSIKAIQIAARLHQENLKVEVKDIFLHQTIAELAEQVQTVQREIDQRDVTGIVPLTAVQTWFFANYAFEHSAHFNQSMLLKINERLQIDALKLALAKLQQHHDALRIRYYREKDHVIQENYDVNCPVNLVVTDLRGHQESMLEMQQHADALQASFDLSTAPLIKTALYQLDEADYCLIIVHHLVVDGVSWRILLEDLRTAYQQAVQGEILHLPNKTDSFQYWAQQVHHYAQTETALSELAYWQQIENAKNIALPCDYDLPHNLEKEIVQLTFTLSREETTQLLTQVNEIYRTEINDILLTALSLAMYRWADLSQIVLSLEGHGREPIIENIDISRTIGWFTSIYPVLLSLPVEKELGYQIKTIKETLRKIPNKGIGYGILRYLTPQPSLITTPQMSFNYLGQFEENQGDWRLVSEVHSTEISPEWQWTSKLDFVGYVIGQQLHFTIRYGQTSFKQATVERLLSNYQHALQELIAHCVHSTATDLTPSDIDYEGLEMDELDQILDNLAQEFKE